MSTLPEHNFPSQQVATFASLLEQRDLAAYRAVAAIETAVLFWEAQDFEAAFAQLERARADFQQAQERITEFHQSHPRPPQGEHHGNRSAA
jgi:predicted negative regulator of RcsB-dependent stress response